VQYNRADVVHLKHIMELCYARLARETAALVGEPQPRSGALP
jgi:hypothetical protein